jgi:hypothetical protein
VDDPLSSETLLDLYKIALDEYRFEVRLGWDRTTYFLVLNSAILTVATGLLKLQDPPAVYLFIGLTDAIPGMHPSLNLAIGTTTIQGDHMRILNEPENGLRGSCGGQRLHTCCAVF